MDKNYINQLLQQGKNLFKTVFDHVPVAMFLIDNRGILEEVNRSATRIFGVTNADRFHISISKLIEQGFLPSQVKIACCPHHNHEFSEVKFVDINQRLKYLKLVAIKIRQLDYHPIWILMIEDITKSVEAKKIDSVVSHRILQAHEDEKLLISREIHDTISQSLAALKMSIQADASKQDLINHVNLLIDTSRTLSQNLRPETIENLGLVPALKQLSKGISQSFNTQISVTTNTEKIHPKSEVALQLFRISQEAITNAARHGQADKIILRLIKRNNHLRMIIEDNGRGFDQKLVKSLTKKSDSLGLRIMSERAEHIGAVLNVRSKPGLGTKVIVSCRIE